jgi:hypothetical protein
MPDNREPIFFAWTKSFWLGLFPALLTLMDLGFNMFSNAETAMPAAAVIAAFIGVFSGLLSWLWTIPAVTAEQVHQFMTNLAPIYAMIVGYQRMHAARPYTLDPRALK